MSEHVETVRDLIDRLGGGRGGAAKVATTLEILAGRPLHVDTVYRWQNEDRVPALWRDTLRALARFRGIALPPSLRAPTLEEA